MLETKLEVHMHYSTVPVFEAPLKFLHARTCRILSVFGYRVLDTWFEGKRVFGIQRQSNRVANIFGRNGGYASPTKHLLLRPATKGNLFLGRRGLKNTLSLSSQRFVNNSAPPVPGKENTKMWKSIARKFCLHRNAEALQHSH